VHARVCVCVCVYVCAQVLRVTAKIHTMCYFRIVGCCWSKADVERSDRDATDERRKKTVTTVCVNTPPPPLPPTANSVLSPRSPRSLQAARRASKRRAGVTTNGLRSNSYSGVNTPEKTPPKKLTASARSHSQTSSGDECERRRQPCASKTSSGGDSYHTLRVTVVSSTTTTTFKSRTPSGAESGSDYEYACIDDLLEGADRVFVHDGNTIYVQTRESFE